jgi:MFS family permease
MFAMSTRLWMLFAARILGGFLTSAMLPTAMAYIGDSTSEKDRGGGMGLMGAAMGLGMIFGPAIGGYMGAISFRAPFYFAPGEGEERTVMQSIGQRARDIELCSMPYALPLAGPRRLAEVTWGCPRSR